MTTTQRRQRRDFNQLANELHELSQRPQFAGERWTWSKVAAVLGVNCGTAQRLIYWMRRNYQEMYWTIGTWGTNYETVPTKLARDAVDGMKNQQIHLLTRLESMSKGWETLSLIDPEPTWRQLAADSAEHFRRMLGSEKEFRELLDRRLADLNWAPAAREHVSA